MTHKSDSEILREIRRGNNPKNEPIGHYTGRCGNCGSSNLWEDGIHYGCNHCGKVHA